MVEIATISSVAEKNMKVALCYPPLQGPGIPLLSQNRQFQWYRSPFTGYTIYPVVPASAATLLKSKGYDVLWEDCVAERKSYAEFLQIMAKEHPDLIAIESKTPTVKQHWQIIDDLKQLFPQMLTVLMGDHVTALPAESLLQSNVDYILTGGDFDFRLLNLVDYLSGKLPDLGEGIYYRKKDGQVSSTKGNQRGYDLNQLPLIDRELTKWWLYSGDNGNFKYKPHTYTMIGRDCWWRRPSRDGKAGCTFCSWTSIFPTWRKAKPKKLLNEIGNLIDLGIKEVFDDTGTFPIGEWLQQFCLGMIKHRYNKRIVLGCNMRAGALRKEEFALMKKANFRFILYGLESANQETIERLNKGTTVESFTESVKLAKKAGLEPHVTTMFGYPWETKKDAQKTVDYIYSLFAKDYIATMQATILMPYPGTALYDEAKEKGWLLTDDYDKYDMSEPILSCPMTEQELKAVVRASYNAFWSPHYLLRRLMAVRNLYDLRFLGFLGAKYVSKLLDFLPKQASESTNRPAHSIPVATA